MADEIEITPEMIGAGADALSACCDELSSKLDSTLEWIALSVFVAMDNARGKDHGVQGPDEVRRGKHKRDA